MIGREGEEEVIAAGRAASIRASEPNLRLKVDGNRRRFRGTKEGANQIESKKEFQAAKRLLQSIEHPCPDQLAEQHSHGDGTDGLRRRLAD